MTTRTWKYAIEVTNDAKTTMVLRVCDTRREANRWADFYGGLSNTTRVRIMRGGQGGECVADSACERNRPLIGDSYSYAKRPRFLVVHNATLDGTPDSWCASQLVNGRYEHLGTFASEDAARAALPIA